MEDEQVKKTPKKSRARYEEGWETNFKQVTDSWAAIAQAAATAQAQAAQNKVGQIAGLQDQINNLFLKWAMDAQGVTNRVAQDAASISARIASNAATVDNLVNVAAITNPAELAETSIGAKVAADVRDAVTQGIAAATGFGTISGPVPQGTTGVAQGTLQTQAPIELAQILANNNTVQLALLKALADINTSLGVILVKVTGEEVTSEKPE